MFRSKLLRPDFRNTLNGKTVKVGRQIVSWISWRAYCAYLWECCFYSILPKTKNFHSPIFGEWRVRLRQTDQALT